MNKMIWDQKVEIQSIRKIQSEGNRKVKNLGTQIVTSEANLTKRLVNFVCLVFVFDFWFYFYILFCGGDCKGR